MARRFVDEQDEQDEAEDETGEQMVQWELRLPRAVAAFGDDLIRQRQFANRSDLAHYLLTRHSTWTRAGWPARMPHTATPEECYQIIHAPEPLTPLTLRSAVAQWHASWGASPTRVRWRPLVSRTLNEYANQVIAEGWYTSTSDFLAYTLARHWAWVQAGYPARCPLEYTPAQAIAPHNRVTPQPAR